MRTSLRQPDRDLLGPPDPAVGMGKENPYSCSAALTVIEEDLKVFLALMLARRDDQIWSEKHSAKGVNDEC